jgi:hypothetical protein
MHGSPLDELERGGEAAHRLELGDRREELGRGIGRPGGRRRGDELPSELATAQGRRGWLRDATRRLDERRAEQARPIPRSRPYRVE